MCSAVLRCSVVSDSLRSHEGDDRGCDGWMASPTQWTWIWVNSWSWWWTGRRGVLQCLGSKRAEHHWATELNWLDNSPPGSSVRGDSPGKNTEVGCHALLNKGNNTCLIKGWALKNWCFWTMVLEKTLESPLDCKEIQPAHPKGDQS